MGLQVAAYLWNRLWEPGEIDGDREAHGNRHHGLQGWGPVPRSASAAHPHIPATSRDFIFITVFNPLPQAAALERLF